jgi:uncharacterized membrane protein required for colicin V production
MNLLDAALAAVALVSVLAGAFRGFVRETVALTGWIVAAVLVLNASTGLGQRLPFDPGSTGARTAIAAILIVVLCTLCAALVGRILRAAMAAAHLGGLVIHFGMSQRPFWKSSRLAPWLEAALRLASPGLAPSVLWPAPAPGA